MKIYRNVYLFCMINIRMYFALERGLCEYRYRLHILIIHIHHIDKFHYLTNEHYLIIV